MHVQDASRAVGVMGSLVSAELKDTFRGGKSPGAGTRAGETFVAEGAATPARSRRRAAKKPVYDWSAYTPPRPSFLGTRVYNPVPLEEIVPYIDWTPFFHAWELRGIYPKIFEQEDVGPKAKELFDDGQKLLDRIVREKLLEARAVIGFFPANSVQDDIEVYADESRHLLTTFHTLRSSRSQEPIRNPATPWRISSRRAKAAEWIISARSPSPPDFTSNRWSRNSKRIMTTTTP